MPISQRSHIRNVITIACRIMLYLQNALDRFRFCTMRFSSRHLVILTHHRQRRQRLIAGPLLIITAVSALFGISLVAILFQKELSSTFLFLFTAMPRFDILVGSTDSVDSTSALYDMYTNFRTISFFVLSIAIIMAGLSFGLESVNLVPPKLGSKILGNGMLYLILIMIFPHFWDMTADVVEWTSLWILNPQDPSMAHETVAKLLSYTSPGVYPKADYALLFGGPGAAIVDATFTSIVDSLTGQGNSNVFQAIGERYQRNITALFTELLFFVLKAIALLTVSLTAFLLGTVRYVLTGLLVVGVPLILTLSLIPQFNRVTGLMRDTLIALMIVPIFSALAISAGVSVLDDLESSDFGTLEVLNNLQDNGVGSSNCDPNSNNIDSDNQCVDRNAISSPPAVQEITYGARKFFMALAVLILAIYFPAMLAPMISNIMSSVQQHISTTGIASGIIASGTQAAITQSGPSIKRGAQYAHRAGNNLSDVIRYGRHVPRRDSNNHINHAPARPSPRPTNNNTQPSKNNYYAPTKTSKPQQHDHPQDDIIERGRPKLPKTSSSTKDQ